MDSKGMDVCNSLERDKACWRGWCLDGRKAACHDGPDSLTVGLGALLAPAQFIATKPGEKSQTGPAEYLATSAIMSKGQYPVKHRAHSLVWQHGQRLLLIKQISLCHTKVHQTSWHQITFGAIGPRLLHRGPCAFSKSAGESTEGSTNCRDGLCIQVLVSEF